MIFVWEIALEIFFMGLCDFYWNSNSTETEVTLQFLSALFVEFTYFLFKGQLLTDGCGRSWQPQDIDAWGGERGAIFKGEKVLN